MYVVMHLYGRIMYLSTYANMWMRLGAPAWHPYVCTHAASGIHTHTHIWTCARADKHTHTHTHTDAHATSTAAATNKYTAASVKPPAMAGTWYMCNTMPTPSKNPRRNRAHKMRHIYIGSLRAPSEGLARPPPCNSSSAMASSSSSPLFGASLDMRT